MTHHALLLALSLAVPQDTVVISDRIACASCAIELTREAIFGADDGPELLADWMAEAAVGDRDGGYWFFSHVLGSQLWRFDANGSARLLGREGAGPSEFSRIRAIGPTPDGGVAAYDGSNIRLIRLSPSGEILSTSRLDAPITFTEQLEPVAGDSMLLAGVGAQGALLGTPIHLLDMSRGTVLASLGETPTSFDIQVMQQNQRRHLSYLNGRLAATHYWRYVTDVYDLETGERLVTYLREAPWYPVVPDLTKVNPPRTRPIPNTVAVRLLPDGSALTLIKRPRANWLEGFEDRFNPEGGGILRARSLVYETLVEHLDLVRGTVKARTVVPGVPLSFVAGRPEIAVVYDDDIVPKIGIYSINLRESPPAPPNPE